MHFASDLVSMLGLEAHVEMPKPLSELESPFHIQETWPNAAIGSGPLSQTAEAIEESALVEEKRQDHGQQKPKLGNLVVSLQTTLQPVFL